MKFNWDLFTKSRNSVTKECTITNSILLPVSNVKNLISDKMIAGFIFRNSAGRVQSFYRPRILPSVDGSDPTRVYGNNFDKRGFLGPVTMDLPGKRFCGYLPEHEMDALDLDKRNPIPPALAAEHGLGEGNYYLLTAPKAMLAYFHQRFPSGPLPDVQHELEENGSGFVLWIALQTSVDTPAKLEKVRAIYQHPDIQADLNGFVAYGTTNVDLESPTVAVGYDLLEAYPDELQDLTSAFVAPAAHPTGSPAVQQDLTTNNDRLEMRRAESGIIKMSLPFVRADIKNGKVDESNVLRPVETIALGEIKGTPSSLGMKEAFADVLQCFLTERENSIDPTDSTQTCNLHHMPLSILETILKGAWPQEPLAEVTAEAQLNGMSILTFRPQNAEDTLLNMYKKEETSNRAQGKSGGGAGSKALRDYLSAVPTMDDGFAASAMVNSRHVFGTLFDLKGMTQDGPRCLFDTITMNMISWFMLQEKSHFPRWRRGTGDPMPHLGALLTQWAELAFVAFGQFANSLHNRSIYADDTIINCNGMDFSAINNFLKDFASIQEQIKGQLRTKVPHTAVPALYRAVNGPAITVNHVNGPAITVADQESRQPISGREGTNPQGNNVSRQQQSSRQNENEGMAQGASKRQKSSPTAPATPRRNPDGWNGILCLREGSSLEQAFPPNFPACKEFVTRNHVCSHGANCSSPHWKTLQQAPARNRKAWADHLRRNPVAFFNVWKLGHSLKESDADLQGLVGPIGKPPPSE